MKLNRRLKTIGDLVEANSFCLDIGCDHALLDIYLLKRDKNIKVIASDILEGPLNQAKKNIQKEHLEDKIELSLADGLEAYKEGVDTVIISGMGGRNMIGICKNHPKILKKINTFVLSPNNYQEDIKRYLCKEGFYISNEEFVEDSKFIYQIIIFKKGKRKYSKKDYFFGPIFIQKKGPLFRKYYEREVKSREILLTLLPKKYYFKRLKLKKEINLINKEIHD